MLVKLVPKLPLGNATAGEVTLRSEAELHKQLRCEAGASQRDRTNKINLVL